MQLLIWTLHAVINIDYTASHSGMQLFRHAVIGTQLLIWTLCSEHET